MFQHPMNPARKAVALGLAFLLLEFLGSTAVIAGEASEKKREAEVAARVDEQVITMQELENALTAQLAKLQEQKYQLIQSKLD